MSGDEQCPTCGLGRDMATECADALVEAASSGGFTCCEADALVRWLEALDEQDIAREFFAAHQRSDDEGDEHWEGSE